MWSAFLLVAWVEDMVYNVKLRTERNKLLRPETKAHITDLQCLVQADDDFGALNDEVTKSLGQINLVLYGVAEDRYKRASFGGGRLSDIENMINEF